LSESRFHESGLPRPLYGVFRVLGGWLAPIGNWVVSVISAVLRFFVNNLEVAAILALLVVLIGAFSAVSLRRRRVLRRMVLRANLASSDDPFELRRLAEEAEVAGDGARAVRLYFRAGVLRLQRGGRLPDRPSLTIGEARRRMRSTDFEAAARSFESVVYGLRPATATDVLSAKQSWLEPLETTRRP
jgi:Domain of unknown function (DUF4129)